jgi:hypothetical protein
MALVLSVILFKAKSLSVNILQSIVFVIVLPFSRVLHVLVQRSL